MCVCFLFFFLVELRRDEEQSDIMRFIKPKLEVVSTVCATVTSLKKKKRRRGKKKKRSSSTVSEEWAGLVEEQRRKHGGDGGGRVPADCFTECSRCQR